MSLCEKYNFQKVEAIATYSNSWTNKIKRPLPNKKEWEQNHTVKSKFELFKESYKTEARWLKAIQHLKELNVINNTPADIGILLKEIQTDIRQEEKENIKESLYNIFIHEILRKATSGFPEWYKELLLKGE